MVFAIVRTLHGGPFGALTVANSTVAIDTLPLSRRNEGIGYYGLSNNLAMALAPTIGLYVYRSTSSFDLLFWIALVVALLGMVIDATVKVEPLPPSSNQSDKSSTVFSRLFYTKGWAIGVNMVCFGFCFGVLSNYPAISSSWHGQHISAIIFPQYL